MLSPKRTARELLVLLIMIFAAVPAAVHAQGGYNPTPFSTPLSLSRGTLLPGSPEGEALSRADYCRIVTQEWGWASCDGIEALVINHVPGADTLLVATPEASGYVRLDDWHRGDRDSEIRAIEGDLREALRAQSRRLGRTIELVGWRTYPTLNERKKYLYYATDVLWDGERQTNIKATVFDRRGYVVFDIVPYADGMSSTEIERLINVTLDRYHPHAQESYAAFQAGDHVAAIGAVGVLASMVGVRHGKTAATGIVAIALAFVKKAWIILLFPLLWLGRLFKR